VTARKDRDRRIREMCQSSYKDHVIRRQTPGGIQWGKSWIVARPDSSNYLAEVVVCYGPRLLIHGDIPDVLFGGFHGEYSQILDWVANSDVNYIATKTLTHKTDYESEIAEDDLNQLLAQWIQEGDKDKEIVALKDIIEEGVWSESKDALITRVYSDYDGVLDVDDFYSVGNVVHHDIIQTQELAKKLMELLAKESTV
jgi:hypothetical protein